MSDFELGAFTRDDWHRGRSMDMWRSAVARTGSRRRAAGLVSPLKNHRAEEPGDSKVAGAVFSPGKEWPFRTVCHNEGAASDARERYFRDAHPDREFRAGLAVFPGGIALRKDTPKRETKNAGGGQRGEVGGFSPDSRRRLIGKLMAFDWPKYCAKGKRQKSAQALFVTLTYSDKCLENLGHYCEQTGLTYGISREKVKRHLDVFGKRLKRLRNYSGMLWKMEVEERKSGEFKGMAVHVHFHCLILLNRPQAARWLRRWLAVAWFQVVGSGDPLHRKAGTQCDIAYGAKNGRLYSYLTKYMGKTYEATAGTIGSLGRVWGIQGDLKMVPPVFFSLDWNGWKTLTRRIRRWGQRSRYLSGFSVNCSGLRVTGHGPGLADLMRGLNQRAMCGNYNLFFTNFLNAFLSEKARKIAGTM